MTIDRDTLLGRIRRLEHALEAAVSPDIAAALESNLARVTAERNALAAALTKTTHEYEAHTFGAWTDNRPETYNETVELCGKCRRPRESKPVVFGSHDTPAVVLARVAKEAAT